MEQKEIFDFLEALNINNNRDWFAENKAWYEKVRTDFEHFVRRLIEAIAGFDGEIAHLDAKKCIFRIYRDTRFSKDKTPYKIHFGAVMSPEDMNKSSGYYIHIQPGGSFVSCGHYMLPPPQLKIVRQGIYNNFENFQEIINQEQFKSVIGNLCDENKLQRIPTGFDKNHPAAEYTKLKHFYVAKKLTDQQMLSNQLLEQVVGLFRIMEPLNGFLNRILRDR